MKNSRQDRLFVTFAFNFFDRHQNFKKLALEIGTSSFFITGGSGLFGNWILSFLDWALQRKYADPNAIVLSRKKIQSDSPNIRYISGDIKSFDYENVRSTYTLHMAAPSASETFGGIDELEKFLVLSKGTERLLNYSRQNNDKRTLILSSGALYGGFDETRTANISELERLAPAFMDDLQGLSIGKRSAEFLTKQFCNKNYVDASIARCFSFIGPGLPTNLHYAAGNFVARAIAGESIVIRGNGLPVRSYMHLGDMVFWIMTILIRGQKGEDYNVGSRQGISIMDLAYEIKRVLNTKSQIILRGEPNESVGHPPNYIYVTDTQKEERELGLSCQAELSTSINDYANYLRAL